MSRRLWVYAAVAIIIVAELIIFSAEKVRSNNNIASINNEALATRKQDLSNYLVKQTDERKLISLAKRLKNQDSSLIKLVADKAYEINPNSRDVVVLASAFHAELEDKLLELDPLYID